MNLQANLDEAVKAIKGNKLRTFLSAAIVTIGITALVGILTAIDAIQYSIVSGLSGLGADSFTLEDLRRQRGFDRRYSLKNTITFDEANMFIDRFDEAKWIGINATVSENVEIKRLSKKTTPNFGVIGIDQYFLSNKGLKIKDGRSFSGNELDKGQNVVIIGPDIANRLFEDNEEPLDQLISFKGKKFKVVGVLEKSGGVSDVNSDRVAFIPLNNANKFAVDQRLYYKITVSVKNIAELDYVMGEARGVMRAVRKDVPGKEDSFDVVRNDSALKSVSESTGVLKIGGAAIAFVTLLGAAVGLMNIMMVSVKERTREIGVRKAMGATTHAIKQQFLVEAISICVLGGLVGILIGVLVGNGVSFLLGNESFFIPWLWIIIGFLVCLFVGALSGFYPAYKAAQLDPIESLRFE